MKLDTLIDGLAVRTAGPDVEVLASLPDRRVVAVRERNVMAIAFHPELAGETRFHRLVVELAAANDARTHGHGEAR